MTPVFTSQIADEKAHPMLAVADSARLTAYLDRGAPTRLPLEVANEPD